MSFGKRVKAKLSKTLAVSAVFSGVVFAQASAADGDATAWISSVMTDFTSGAQSMISAVAPAVGGAVGLMLIAVAGIKVFKRLGSQFG